MNKLLIYAAVVYVFYYLAKKKTATPPRDVDSTASSDYDSAASLLERLA